MKNKLKINDLRGFINPIYPRLFWIIKLKNIKDIHNYFNFIENFAIKQEDFDRCDALTIPAINKKDSKLGVVVIFNSEGDFNPNIIAHECYHVTDYMVESFNLDYNSQATNEHLAYLNGWLNECVYNAIT